jgi:hypothetical protein
MVDRASGRLLFARYAFPPNHYGYCGPEDADGFFRSGVAGDDHGLRARARNFDGALPHLQLIADAGMRAHPLGGGAAIIGECVPEHPGIVVTTTTFGGTRVVDMPLGEQLPRIC